MGYIFGTLFLLLFAGGCFYAAKVLKSEAGFPLMLVRMVGAGVLVMVVIFTLIRSVYQIPAGQVAVIYHFGEIVGQKPEGLQFIAPWDNAESANVQIQSHRFPKLACFSRETQDVFVSATLNINVSPQAIQKLYRTVGKNWFKVLVEPRVAQIFKDETVKFNSVDIAPAREAIRKTVSNRLERELTLHSIEVRDLLVDNIDFRDGFKAAIEAKQIATQRALEEEQNIQVKKRLADQKIETAKGDAQAIYINAEKQALANQKLSASLTPQLIQYTMVSKLSDKIEVMLLPAGQNFILSPDMLKKGGKE